MKTYFLIEIHHNKKILSNKIVTSERALELWNYIYKNQKIILAKPML